MTPEERAAYLQKVIAAAPPLSAAQKARLVSLFAPRSLPRRQYPVRRAA